LLDRIEETREGLDSLERQLRDKCGRVCGLRKRWPRENRHQGIYGRAMFLFRVKNPKKYATALEAGAGQGRLMQVVVQSIQIA
jgi:chromosome segregation ATPase